MTDTQGRTRVTEFIRDIEIMADRFPDVNERGIIGIFWWGIHQPIRSRIIEMRVNTTRGRELRPFGQLLLVTCVLRQRSKIQRS